MEIDRRLENGRERERREDREPGGRKGRIESQEGEKKQINNKGRNKNNFK